MLFKSTYFLKDIIPNNYIDIHNHILPAIDDGAQTIEQSKRLIAEMKKINILSVIPTPHTYTRYWNNSKENIQIAYETVNKIDSDPFFFKGYASEYMLDNTLLERIKREELLCIKHNFILVELPFLSCPLNLYQMLFELKCSDYKIIIAHPERYTYFHDNIEKFHKLKAFGVYFQLNLLSLTGQYGKRIRKMAERLIENDLYDFTGSDIHNMQHISSFATKPLSYNKKKVIDLLKKNHIFHSK